jgi:hypothetical protein
LAAGDIFDNFHDTPIWSERAPISRTFTADWLTLVLNCHAFLVSRIVSAPWRAIGGTGGVAGDACAFSDIS